MQVNPFAPQPDFVSPSLNRAMIVDLPGVALPEDVRGKRGVDLLAAKVLRRMIEPQTAVLHLSPDDPHLLLHFAELIGASSVAQEIADRYGRRLGYLLLMLKRGDDVNRAARPTWRDEHWAWWAGIDNSRHNRQSQRFRINSHADKCNWQH